MTTQGRRVYANPDGSFKLERGDYCLVPMKDGTARWFARVPDDRFNDMDMGDLSNHTITEHEDGTITVSPSILHHGWTEGWKQQLEWHGFLEKGIWRTV
jgi:hypothetical protein